MDGHGVICWDAPPPNSHHQDYILRFLRMGIPINLHLADVTSSGEHPNRVLRFFIFGFSQNELSEETKLGWIAWKIKEECCAANGIGIVQCHLGTSKTKLSNFLVKFWVVHSFHSQPFSFFCRAANGAHSRKTKPNVHEQRTSSSSSDEIAQHLGRQF